MPPGIGYSYQPGGDTDTPLQPRGQGGQGIAPQQAIRTLSLRVPQTQSVPGLSPLPLLNASGGGGTDLDMLLTALLRAFGQGGGGQQFSGRSQGRNATPRVIPGGDGPAPPPGDIGPAPRPRVPQDFPTPSGGLGPAPMPQPPDSFMGGNTGIGNTGRGNPGPIIPLF